jgi:type IV pilus assembly protein PilC
MPKFNWQGKSRDGQLRSGTLVADTANAVVLALKTQAITATRVKAAPKPLAELIPLLRPRVKIKELLIFTRQFATMIDAGLPLVQCLDILANQATNKTFKKVLTDVKQDVEAGSTFSDALGKHPRVFDRLYVNLVAAGEVGGILDTILNRLANFMEKAEALRRRVKGAMVYPISVLVIAIGVIVLMLVKVIPVFEKMFADFGSALPAPTQMVINMSHFMQAYILHFIAALVVLGFVARRTYRTDRGRWWFDSLFLKIPVFGTLLKKVAVARFTRTLSTMLSSGVPILDALDIVARTAGNVVVEREILVTRSAISEGKQMIEPLMKSRVFPSMVVQMIGVGEQTGAMDSMLGKIADFYDDEVDSAVAALTSLLEPVMMVVLGGSIGSLLIAMYLPIFKLAEAVK